MKELFDNPRYLHGLTSLFHFNPLWIIEQNCSFVWIESIGRLAGSTLNVAQVMELILDRMETVKTLLDKKKMLVTSIFFSSAMFPTSLPIKII